MSTAISQLRGIGGITQLAGVASRLRSRSATSASDQDRERLLLTQAMVLTFLAVRAVHLSQGYLDLATGWGQYHHPVLAAAVTAGCTGESAWIIVRSWRRGRLDPGAVMVEVACGVAALFLLTAALRGSDRTTSLNWMLPYTVGTAVAAALALRARPALLTAAALGTLYLVSVWPQVIAGRGAAPTAIVNAVSYLGFFAVAALLRAVLLYLADLLQQARAESLMRGEQLAAERERARQHMLIHDSALQTLEAIAKGWGEGGSALRLRAQQEAQRLRLALRHDQPGDAGAPCDLDTRLGLLVAEFAGRGLNIEYVSAELVTAPPGPVADALCEAAREALTNIVKHAAVPTAVVRVATVGGGVELTIRDRGRGFDESSRGAGFGIANSIQYRIGQVGGCVDISSVPGAGTLVRLWSPA
jgi:signal transduction histidine kinase